MPRVEWNAFLSVGHDAIDDDHKQLIAVLNRLADGESRRRRDVVVRAVEEMDRYAGAHFVREEEMMQRIRYPLVDEHRRAHRDLAARMALWRDRVQGAWYPWQGGTFFVTLSYWLLSHILEDDRMVADFIRSGAVSPRLRSTGDDLPAVPVPRFSVVGGLQALAT